MILAGLKDIAAMKLSAVTGRGSKKDFIDICFLLKEFSLKQQLELYLNKYPQGSELMVLKSLSYFDDAEIEKQPKMFIEISWEEIKKKIKQEVRGFDF